ncbi:Dr1-associated corepressor [Nematocida sp. AWRm77]|nr:Dr1-associated corepressor [Nematocida sp. AWRm77]
MLLCSMEDKPSEHKRKTKCRFPIARIKKIMQFDEDIGKVSSSAPIVISHAIEMFLVDALKELEADAKNKSSKKISLVHLEACVQHCPKMQFLRTVMPEKK